MSETIENVETPSPADVAAQALAEAAAKAPTTEAEARAQVEAEAAAAKAVQRPDNVPEKFWDATKGAVNHEALLASYAELEKKVGAPKEEPKADEAKTEDQPEEEKKAETPAEAPKASEVVSKLSENFAANGKLSDDDYALAEKIGHDRATVDAFIAGQKALAEQATQRITDAAGGKEAMDTMFVWAKTGLTSAEIDAFNATMNGADVSAAEAAMRQLKAKYEVANGREPNLIGGKPPAASVDVYTSWAEVQRDMAKPEYEKDHAFRAKVEAKLGRSNNIR